MTKPLLRWQEFMGFNDERAACALALSVGEYRRQLSSRPSRQTARLCVLLAVYNPDLEAITSAAANLDRLPARPPEATADDLSSEWS
jgi:hypothetical protein